MTTEAAPFEPRSKRGKRQYTADALSPLEQVRVIPTTNDFTQTTNAWAYFIRPDGATIRDALIAQPNGGVPLNADAKQRAKYGTNAAYYRERERAKGFEFVGPRLTEAGVRRLVEVIYANREDEILFCEDEVVNCQHTIENSDLPQVRDQARKRKAQFSRRLEYLKQDLDPEAMSKELNDIVQAQELANLDPKLLAAMRSMMNEKVSALEEKIAHFAKGREGGAKQSRATGPSPLESAAGEAFIDAD